MFSSHRDIESKGEVKSKPSHISTVTPQADDGFDILMPMFFISWTWLLASWSL